MGGWCTRGWWQQDRWGHICRTPRQRLRLWCWTGGQRQGHGCGRHGRARHHCGRLLRACGRLLLLLLLLLTGWVQASLSREHTLSWTRRGVDLLGACGGRPTLSRWAGAAAGVASMVCQGALHCTGAAGVFLGGATTLTGALAGICHTLRNSWGAAATVIALVHALAPTPGAAGAASCTAVAAIAFTATCCHKYGAGSAGACSCASRGYGPRRCPLDRNGC